MCKHLLAARLAHAIGVIDIQQEIEDTHLAEKLYSQHSVTRSNYQEEAHNTSSDSI